MTLGTPESVKISMEIELQLLGSAANLNNHFTLSGMDTLELFASLLAKIDVAQLLSLKLKDAFNMYCWMDTVLDPKIMRIPQLVLKRFGRFQTIAMGLECESYVVFDFNYRHKNITHSPTKTGTGSMWYDMTNHLTSENAIRDITKIVNTMLNVTIQSMTGPEFRSKSISICLRPITCVRIQTVWQLLTSDEDNVAMLMFQTSSTPDFTLAATSCATSFLF